VASYEVITTFRFEDGTGKGSHMIGLTKTLNYKKRQFNLGENAPASFTKPLCHFSYPRVGSTLCCL